MMNKFILCSTAFTAGIIIAQSESLAQSHKRIPRVEIGTRAGSSGVSPIWIAGSGKTFSCKLDHKNVEEIKLVKEYMRQDDGNYQIRNLSGNDFFVIARQGYDCGLVSPGVETSVAKEVRDDTEVEKLAQSLEQDFVCRTYTNGRSVVSFRKRVVAAGQNRYNGQYTLVLNLGGSKVIYPPRPGEICELQ